MNNLDYAVAELPSGATRVIVADREDHRILLWCEVPIGLWSEVRECLCDMMRQSRCHWLDTQMGDMSDLIGGTK